jgi:hypothetical protein
MWFPCQMMLISFNFISNKTGFISRSRTAFLTFETDQFLFLTIFYKHAHLNNQPYYYIITFTQCTKIRSYFSCLALFAGVWFNFSLCFFLTLLCSCVLFDSYVLLADDHVNNVSYFPFMSIKTYFCVLCEGYYVITSGVGDFPVLHFCRC